MNSPYNIPNFLTLLRVILTFVILYLIAGNYSLMTIGIVFIIAMVTDALDGFAARRLHQETEFGRRFDVIADRFLLISTVVALVSVNLIEGIFTRLDLALIFIMMAREIVSFPFAIVGFFSGGILPNVKAIGKIVTILQSITFPVILFKWNIYLSIGCAAATGICGVIAGLTYMNDIGAMKKPTEKNKDTKPYK